MLIYIGTLCWEQPLDTVYMYYVYCLLHSRRESQTHFYFTTCCNLTNKPTLYLVINCVMNWRYTGGRGGVMQFTVNHILIWKPKVKVASTSTIKGVSVLQDFIGICRDVRRFIYRTNNIAYQRIQPREELREARMQICHGHIFFKGGFLYAFVSDFSIRLCA